MISNSREDFIVSPGSASAVAMVDAWPAWPDNRLALIGPEGSGKTHLGLAWAARAGAVVLSPDDRDVSALQGRAVLLDDADRMTADEVLFDLINMADTGATLMLTGRTAPGGWPTALPDLRSRLNALVVASLAAPDDTVLEGVLRKFFAQRNIRVADEVLAYLLHRIERSVPAVWDVVARIDERADAQKREITRPLIREVLEEGGRTSEPHD